MTTTINASTTAGLVQTADTSGVLALQTANTTALTISAAQVVNFANAPTVAGSPIGATPGGSTTQLQYNNAGAFGGISGVTTDGTRMTASTTIGVGAATPSTSGVGITFPATFSNSTNANTLDDYEEGSFTVTGTGFTTTITGTAYYTKIGNAVSLSIPDLAGTSNSTSFTITGLPVELRPINAFVMGGVRIYNNSTIYYGHIYWPGTGTISCAWDASENAFSASVIKGITNRFNVCYSVI
jgi:hypothetical protein